MTSSEDALWETERRHLAPFGRILRVEHAVELGWPDVYYLLRRPAPYHAQRASGWIENKYLPGWPARPDTLVRIPSLTPEQGAWLGAEMRAGGRACLALQVASEYLFFPGALVTGLFLDHPAPQTWVRRQAGLIMSDGFKLADALRFLAG